MILLWVYSPWRVGNFGMNLLSPLSFFLRTVFEHFLHLPIFQHRACLVLSPSLSILSRRPKLCQTFWLYLSCQSLRAVSPGMCLVLIFHSAFTRANDFFFYSELMFYSGFSVFRFPSHTLLLDFKGMPFPFTQLLESYSLRSFLCLIDFYFLSGKLHVRVK